MTFMRFKSAPASLPRSVLLAAATIAMSIGTIAVAPAQTAVPPQMKSQAMALAALCRADYDRLCQGVQPGGGRVLNCLNANAEKLSASCRGALPDASALASRATAAGVMPK
jgi:Cysteine rich repeat